MRSDTLLFLHVLAGMVAVGGLIATGVVALERRRRPGPESGRGGRLAWQLPAGTVAATIVAIARGEGLAGQEDVSAAWLDVSRGLAVFGLVVGGVVLALLARLARTRPRLSGAVAPLAGALVLVGLAVAFVMAAKPA